MRSHCVAPLAVPLKRGPSGFAACAAWAIAVALLGLGGAACSDDAFTSDQCADLPKYDIREAQRTTGAVGELGIVPVSPLTPEQQRSLQNLQREGCITLPAKGYSLGSGRRSDADAGN